MIEFLLALNIAALIYVSVVVAPHDAGDWIKTIIPAWLQSIGTLVAVFVGWRALTTWRSEGLVSSKAEQARNLMPDFEQLVAAINRLRRPAIGYPSAIKGKFLQFALSERRRKAAEDLQAIRTQHWRSRTSIIDDKVSDDMQLLLALADEVLDAFSYVQFEYSNYDSGEVENTTFDNDIKPFLNTLGMWPRKEHREDVVEARMQKLAVEIRARLRAHMAFKDS